MDKTYSIAPPKRDNTYYLSGIEKRDNSILKEIYEAFLPKVIAFIRKNRGQEDDARDIFNKVIYQLSARLEVDKIEVKSTFEGYIFTACKNLWRRELNKKQHRRVTSDTVKELYYEQKDFSQSVLEQERWELFREMVEQVSDGCKKILALFFQKVSGKDIMDQLGYASETTVRQRVFKCKAQLTKLIKADGRYLELKNI